LLGMLKYQTPTTLLYTLVPPSRGLLRSKNYMIWNKNTSRKWHFRDSNFKNFPQSKRAPYDTACFCNTSMRKTCTHIFVCKLRLHFPDSKHLRGFVCHEIFRNLFVIWKFLAYTPQLYMLATALRIKYSW
jgi:hypothetical protein